MKLIKVLPMLAVAAFSLSACASKCDYAKFHELAVEAAKKAKDVSFSKVVFSGYYTESGKKQQYDGVTIKSSKGAFVPGLAADEIVVAALLEAAMASVMPEDNSVNYYAGGSFKITGTGDNKDKKMEWNQYGLLTSYSAKDSKYSVKYSK